MKSYASIDRIECYYIVCEVELHEIEISNTIDYLDRETKMMDIPLVDVLNSVGDIFEGDILVVEHDGEQIIEVYSKSEEEKQRRIECIRQLIGSREELSDCNPDD